MFRPVLLRNKYARLSGHGHVIGDSYNTRHSHIRLDICYKKRYMLKFKHE